MKNIIRNSLTTLALASFALTAQAVPITGAISLAGSVTPTGGNINTATSFSSLGPAISTAASGSFGTATSGIVTFPPAIGSSLFTMTPFSFGTSAAPLLAPTPVVVWTTTNGAITTSFTLTSISLVDHNVTDQLALLGTGFFSMTGFDVTPGNFNFTAQQAITTFSFSSSQSATAPDAGSTAVLLALGLGCLGFGARRFKLAKA